jgi:hypothetical protein
VPAPPGWGIQPPVAPRSALPPAPVLAPPGISPYPQALPYRVQPQRSLAERANEQLRRDRKDPLTQGVENAAKDDCLRAPDKDSTAGGLLNAPIAIARALTGNCPK